MAKTARDSRILIAGAGIGGLSAAIALARRGIATQVLERTASFSSEGAGIQLGPNATRILDDWGVLDRLSSKSVVCEEIIIGDGITGERLTTVELGELARQRYDAPFLMVHRGDLHQALLDTAMKFGLINITMDREVLAYRQFPDKVVLTTNGTIVHGRALIAADGLWSGLRQQIDGGARLSFSGKTAWRSWLEPGDLPEFLQGPRTGLWLSGSAHLVHYPVRGGKKINLVAVVNERWGGRASGWSQEADAHMLLPSFEQWNPRIADLARSTASWRKYSLFHLPPLRTWSQGSVTLLGDAAHPVQPFLAQGGAMAIEDAAVLGRILSAYNDDPWRAFRSFEIARIERTARTGYESRRMGGIYHMDGLLRLARNFVLRRQTSRSHLKRLDWLYGFRDED